MLLQRLFAVSAVDYFIILQQLLLDALIWYSSYRPSAEQTCQSSTTGKPGCRCADFCQHNSYCWAPGGAIDEMLLAARAKHVPER